MDKNKFTVEKVQISEDEVLLKRFFDGNDLLEENIIVVDSIMGSGKTSWAIDKMKSVGEKYIYITPYLDEIQRVKSSLEGKRYLYEPTNNNNFGAKKYDFYKFVQGGVDIVSTHSLFTTCDIEILQHIKKHNYTLVLDEVMNVVEIMDISKSDFEMLLQTESICISSDGKVQWLKDNYNGSFDWIKKYALAGQLYKHPSNDTQKVALLVWQFPFEVFKYFKEVYILTYLFDGQIQKYYFDFHNLSYSYKQVQKIDGKYELIDYDKQHEYEEIRNYKKMINIYNGNLNCIGDSWYSLSLNYFKSNKNSANIIQLKKNAENYIQHIVKGKAEFNMWTTFKEFGNKIKGKGYAKGFISLNARATNQYANKRNLIYLCNRFLPTYIESYFRDMGAEIDQELWALSELVQWIWRSGIRNNESINIYIPSARMRILLGQWLNCEKVGKASNIA